MFSSNSGSSMMVERRWSKTNIETAPNCPRCASTNTKFCYYNNYSHSQPRYFCKGCRRYWTKGGSLRNVPFGGGCRKNRRGVSKSVARSPTGSDLVGSPPTFDSGGNSAASDIDLALVFSNFLNPRPDPGGFVSVPEYLPNPDYNPEEEGIQLPFQNPTTIEGLDMDFTGMLPPDQFEVSQSMDPGLNGLQELMLSDDGISEDIMWSEDASYWQQQEQQQQGFEGILDDHSMFHNNLLNGNWTSFDIPSYGA